MNEHSPAAPSGGSEMSANGHPGSPCRRVLVVDDEAAICRISAFALGRAGFQVDVATNGAMAWDILQTNAYDVLVTDNNMPVLTGVELLKKVRGAGMNMAVVMVTGFFPKDDFERHPWIEPNAVLLKPFVMEDLVGTVQTLLKGDLAARSGPETAA